jgi:serine phosphatase RsbU (regulator of sigma subunit)
LRRMIRGSHPARQADPRMNGIRRVRISRRVLALMVGIVLVFVLAFGAIALAVNRAGDIQRQIRVAQGARSFLRRLQLEEESGLRGYTSTGDRLFLQPYQQAMASAPSRLARLRALVVGVAAPETIKAIDDLERTHLRWLTEIAEPLVADPQRRDARALQLRGKELFDRIRDDNVVVNRALDGAAVTADKSLRYIVSAIIAVGIGLGAALLGLMLWLVNRQYNLERQLSDQYDLEEQLTRQRLLLEHEREVANALQEALLPRDLPALPGLALHARYHPAEDLGCVGGDWYDAFALTDGRIFITVGDVTGHGISATATMSRVRQAILAAALHQADPATILRIANRDLCQMSREPLVGTVVCAFIDPSTHEILYATAGHPPLVLVCPDSRATFLMHGGTPLGVDGDCEFRTYVTQAVRSALLIFYTDGLIEATGDILEGEARLLDAAEWVARAEPDDPASALKQRILGDASPRDDIAILTVGFTMSRFTAARIGHNGPVGALAAGHHEPLRHDDRPS